MGVGTQKIEGTFDVRNVTKPIVAAGQVADRGQGVWLNGDGGFVLDMKSARKIEKPLGDKCGFVELRKQKGVYVIPCEEQSSNLYPLVGQEPKQGTQMDRGEGEIEEERKARVKSAPVLPTDKEREEHEATHATFRSWCEACVAGRATEDSHRRPATEPSVPLVAMDYGFLGRDTDVELATILVLIQRPHGAVGACQVLRTGPEPYAIDCVLAYLDTWGLREVLPKADTEPAIQALVDAVRVRRARGRWWKESEVLASVIWCGRTCSAKDREPHENLRVCVAGEAWPQSRQQEDCSTVACQARGVRAQSIFEARWECDSPLAQVGETVDFKIVRGEMAELEPRWATGTFLRRTDESDEAIVGTAVGIEFARSFRRRTRDKQ